MKEIERQSNRWVLYEVPGQGYVLSVECGTSASFETNIALDFDEKEQYMIAGSVYLEGLAQKIVYAPWAYRSRHVDLPPTDFSK